MKLSDALRGAADRAPVDEVSVGVGTVAGRVRRQRAVRTGSTALLGAGACAVIAFGALGPVSTIASSGDSGEANAPAAALEGEAMEESGAGYDAAGDTALARPAEQWWCGSTFSADDGTWAWGDASGVDFELGEPTLDGTELQLPHTLTASRPVDLISSPDALIVWDGIVVGRLVGESPFTYGPADEPMLPEEVYERLDPSTEFSSLEQSTVMESVNCWDGEPLPAGTYEVHQAWTLAYADGAAEPAPAETTEPAGEPTTGPTDVPTEDVAGTDSSVATDGAESGAAGGGAGGSEGTASEGEPTPGSAPFPETFRVAAGPVQHVVDGDPVDDPFGAYLGSGEPGEPPVDPIDPVEPSDPVDTPDDLLTPELARELFDATRASALWDMAPGSQRWIKTLDAMAHTDDAWESRYYGCVWDQGVDGAFPKESAEMGLLDVQVDVPSSISVSYGYVVDGNPLVTGTTTNVSKHTIPGYYSGQTPVLALVKDGRVVAESYTESLQRGGHGVVEPAIAEMSVVPDDGFFAPGQQSHAEALLRNVNACDGSSAVEPGTYTVLVQSNVHVGSGYAVAFGGAEDLMAEQEAADGRASNGELDIESGAEGSSVLEPDVGTLVDEPSFGGDDATDAAILPAPDGAYDWVEFQVWTSLGSLTVR
ncbi:hypothetical protein [Demequina sp. NBRC 110053]|uniref:hypothetical protein n=1 Tax=Demequina sp. NBRC 110053 TaxID=1570342 RepID=UPI000A01E43B|nr:hypothetical protein [Demequina sp. NBRC 110053]